MPEIVVYKVPRVTGWPNVVVKYEYYVFVVGLGYLASILRENWATNISNGATAFDSAFDVCRYAKINSWEITSAPSEVMEEWAKTKNRES